MSIDRCRVCERFVDTDFDVEAYAEVATYTAHPAAKEPVDHVCVCEWCRENHVDEDGLFWPDGLNQGD